MVDNEPRSSQTKAGELEERLINFAVRIIKLSANLPKTPVGGQSKTSKPGLADAKESSG